MNWHKPFEKLKSVCDVPRATELTALWKKLGWRYSFQKSAAICFLCLGCKEVGQQTVPVDKIWVMFFGCFVLGDGADLFFFLHHRQFYFLDYWFGLLNLFQIKVSHCFHYKLYLLYLVISVITCSKKDTQNSMGGEKISQALPDI